MKTSTSIERLIFIVAGFPLNLGMYIHLILELKQYLP